MLQGIDPDDIDLKEGFGKELHEQDTNRKILMELMERGIMDDSGTTPGKTIVFCATQNHAEAMKKLLDEMYPHYSGRLGEVITSRMERVHGKGGLLDQFKNHDFPRIAFSVTCSIRASMSEKLSTRLCKTCSFMDKILADDWERDQSSRRGPCCPKAMV